MMLDVSACYNAAAAHMLRMSLVSSSTKMIYARYNEEIVLWLPG